MANRVTDIICWTAKHHARKVEHVRSAEKAARRYALTLWEQELWDGEEPLVVYAQFHDRPVVARITIDFSIEVRLRCTSTTTPKTSELPARIKAADFDTPLRVRDAMPEFTED